MSYEKYRFIKNAAILLLIMWLFFGCKSQVEKNKIFNNEAPLTQECNNISATIGVVVINDDNYKTGDEIFLYKKNEKNPSDTIQITEEYQIIVLRCLRKENNRFVVLYNDIPKDLPNSSLIKYQSWEEHIIQNVFAITFNVKKNPIKISPDIDSDEIVFNQEVFYHPSSINGNWLKIKWEHNGNWKYGWVRWREENCLYIELFYFA